MLFIDADSILFSSKNYECIENVMDIKLNEVHEWLHTKKLSINLSKTSYIIFNLNIYINNRLIDQSDSFKLFAVLVDSRIS